MSGVSPLQIIGRCLITSAGSIYNIADLTSDSSGIEIGTTNSYARNDNPYYSAIAGGGLTGATAVVTNGATGQQSLNINESTGGIANT